MRVYWTHAGCNAVAKRILHRAWRDVEPALQDRLEYRETVAEELHLVVNHDRHQRLSWSVQATLKTPKNSLVASAESAVPEFAIDDCVGRIVDQLVELPMTLDSAVAQPDPPPSETTNEE